MPEQEPDIEVTPPEAQRLLSRLEGVQHGVGDNAAQILRLREAVGRLATALLGHGKPPMVADATLGEGEAKAGFCNEMGMGLAAVCQDLDEQHRGLVEVASDLEGICDEMFGEATRTEAGATMPLSNPKPRKFSAPT